MKRSEMVKTIKNFFYDNDFYNFNDEHADLLLDKLESQGMKLPSENDKWKDEMLEIAEAMRRANALLQDETQKP
jgi:hypothetical protein